jgi:hypothetical protein
VVRLNQKPTTSETCLALANAVTVDEKADEEKAPRDGCGHKLYMYQTAVPSTSTMTTNKASPRNI